MTLFAHNAEPVYMSDAATALEVLRTAATSGGIALTPEGFADTLRDFLAAHDADLIEAMLETVPRRFVEDTDSTDDRVLMVSDVQAFADRRRVQL
jgi:hypothetical protein